MTAAASGRFAEHARCLGCRIQAAEIEGNTATPCTCSAEHAGIESVVRAAVIDWNTLGTAKPGLSVSAHIAQALVDAGVLLPPGKPTAGGDQ